MRGIFVAVLAAGLAGCVTATNTLSVEQVQGFRYAGVNVTFAQHANIWWGDGERAYAASKGLPATESETLAKTPEGQAYLRNAITTRIKAATERHVAGALTGARPASTSTPARPCPASAIACCWGKGSSGAPVFASTTVMSANMEW